MQRNIQIRSKIMVIDPLVEAILIKAICEFDLPSDCPHAEDGYEPFKTYSNQLEMLSRLEFTDAGIEVYNIGLLPDERFDDLTRARAFIERAQKALSLFVEKGKRRYG